MIDDLLFCGAVALLIDFRLDELWRPRWPAVPRVFGEAHLRRILSAYAAYYNQVRTHLALQKDAPFHRTAQRSGTIVAIPILAGLHHQYARI